MQWRLLWQDRPGPLQTQLPGGPLVSSQDGSGECPISLPAVEEDALLELIKIYKWWNHGCTEYVLLYGNLY